MAYCFQANGKGSLLVLSEGSVLSFADKRWIRYCRVRQAKRFCCNVMKPGYVIQRMIPINWTWHPSRRWLAIQKECEEATVPWITKLEKKLVFFPQLLRYNVDRTGWEAVIGMRRAFSNLGESGVWWLRKGIVKGIAKVYNTGARIGNCHICHYSDNIFTTKLTVSRYVSMNQLYLHKSFASLYN